MRGRDERKTEITRRLRGNPTSAERKLWRMLRDRRLGGYKFLRQHPIEGFVVDFVCRDGKLVIEVDGATHSTVEEMARDGRRDAALMARGYRVLRVQNAEVYDALDAVCEAILAALAEG